MSLCAVKTALYCFATYFIESEEIPTDGFQP